jgi:AcrR family transcriptional regulator
MATPRKPRQQRSRATVDAIVEAGFVCVSKRGIADTTTRHVADIAGISVGSLYEYFANKDEIFDAMNERFVADVVVLIQRVSPEIMPMDVERAVTHIFDAFNAFLTRNDDRYLKVARQVIQADTRDYVEPVSKALQEMLLRYLMQHPTLLRADDDIPAMAYIIINAGIFVMLRQLSAENPPISFEQLKRGMARLVAAYVGHGR